MAEADGGVLLTVAGRKSYVLEALRKASRPTALWVGDADPRAPIRRIAARTFIRLPLLTDPNRYVEEIEKAARAHDIRAVLPLNDIDVCALADARSRFQELGIRLLVPTPTATRTCCDKLRFAEWLEAEGVPGVPTWPLDATPLTPGPYVVKERHGQGSRGFAVVESLDHVRGDLIAQPYLEGEHYDADVIRSWSGRSSASCVKQKIEMQAGTASMTESVEVPEIAALAVSLAARLDARGAIDVDFIVTEHGLRVLEVNPRLGGLFAHACLSAPDLPDALLGVAMGEEAPDLAVEPGVRVFTEWSPTRVPPG